MGGPTGITPGIPPVSHQWLKRGVRAVRDSAEGPSFRCQTKSWSGNSNMMYRLFLDETAIVNSDAVSGQSHFLIVGVAENLRDGQRPDKSRSVMHNIAQEFKRSKAVQRGIDGIAFFSGAHKDDREWQVLGAACKLITKAGGTAPAFATKSEAPDFVVYSPDKTRLGGVEIVEILRPDYRRHAFYKQRALPDAPEFFQPDGPLADPWSPLRAQISKKAAKSYPGVVSLLVYYDIGRFSLSDRNAPFHNQLLGEHARALFDGMNNFEEVLVLFSDMACLVQLYPDARTIVPDANGG